MGRSQESRIFQGFRLASIVKPYNGVSDQRSGQQVPSGPETVQTRGSSGNLRKSRTSRRMDLREGRKQMISNVNSYFYLVINKINQNL